MKYIILALFTFILYNEAVGQIYKELTLSYKKEEFSFNDFGGGLSITSDYYPIKYDTNTLEPGLPYVILHILIGNDEKFLKVSSDFSYSSIFEGVDLRPNPFWILGTQSQVSPKKPSDKVAYTGSDYPHKSIHYVGTQSIDGYKYLSFLVCPFRFQPQGGILSFSKTIKLRIELEKSEETSLSCHGEVMRRVVKHLINNVDDLETLYPIEASRENNVVSVSNPIDYIIITADSLKSTFQELAKWKTKKGVKTRVLGIESDIIPLYNYCNSDGTPNIPYRIRKAITQYKTNNGISYVLLGGNIDIVPTVRGFLKYDGSYSSEESACPCDLFYACTDDWDLYSTNAYWGHTNNVLSIIPQIHVTRIPAGNATEANIMINRIINYERDPHITLWKDSILMAGHLSDETQYSYLYNRPISAAEFKGDQMYTSILLNKSISRYRLYDSWTDHPNGSNYQFNNSHLINKLSNGYPFIHIDVHGNYGEYTLEENVFNVGNALAFNNPQYSMIVTCACSTNDFYHLYHSDCLGESFMKNPNGGIIAYWGSSAKEWASSEGFFAEASIDKYNKRLYCHLFEEEDNHFGEIATQAKTDLLTSNMSYQEPYRWTLFALNPLGDTEMPIYIYQPRSFDNATISYNAGQLYIDLNDSAISNGYPYKVCVMSLNDFGESYYVINESSLDQLFVDVPVGNDYSVCVTRPGYRPFVINCYNSGYIQNDTIADYSVCYSDNLQIGRNVTNAKPYGTVSIENDAVLKIYSNNGVTIQNSFEVKQGATLEIRPGDY